MEFSHEPVLLSEVLAGLNPRAGGTYVDGTIGGGGHARAVLERAGAEATLIGIDHDPEALTAAKERLADLPGNVELVHGNYADLDRILAERNITAVDGILLDLGVSSHQIDTPARGFSYIQDGPLDMRMDPTATQSAADLVNDLPADELARIFFEYGEERFSRRIAAAIIAARAEARITTTARMAAVIEQAVPVRHRYDGHPAKRVFQALRIATNNELAIIAPTIRTAVRLLKPGGRLAIISFHSLEDRIVKETYRELARGCICPPRQLICTCGRHPEIALITRKPVTATEEELARNQRAHSAKLRVAERLAGF